MYFEKLTQLGIRLRKRSGQEKTTCPQCSAGRKKKTEPCLSVNINEGSYNCFNCKWQGNVRSFVPRETIKKFEKPSQDMLKSIDLNEKIKKFFSDRAISEETLKKFFIHGKEEWLPQTNKKGRCIVFPYIRNNEIVNAKYRDGNKNFKLVKGAELIFFGMQTLEGRRCAIIVEGEIDALSAYEAGFGQDYEPICNSDGEVIEHELGRFAVLSVPNGASAGNNRLEYLDNSAEYLAEIEEFVIATDNDAPGQALRDELIRRFGAEKCRTVRWDILKSHQTNGNGPNFKPKDFNEVLVHFGKDALKSLVLSSQEVQVDGIFYVEDLKNTMLEKFDKGVQLGDTTRFKELDTIFRWKKGDINIFIGYANWGKTFFALQLMLIKSIWDGWRWAVFSPENYPADDFYDDMVEMYVGKWIKNMSREEYIEAIDFINDHIYFIYPSDEHSIENIHEKFKYLIMKKGLDGVMIDPFNQLDKTQRAYERDDQYMSVVFKDIKRFALMNKVCYNVVMHPKNPPAQNGNALPVVGPYDIAQGAMTNNKADQILSYYRPNYHVNPDDTRVEVYTKKVKRRRTGGKIGMVELNLNWNIKRFFDPITGEMPCDPKEAKRATSSHNPDNITQPEISTTWMPYKDDGTEAPF
jgi:twinkle protein